MILRAHGNSNVSKFGPRVNRLAVVCFETDLYTGVESLVFLLLTRRVGRKCQKRAHLEITNNRPRRE